jgi:hypothetical protein
VDREGKHVGDPRVNLRERKRERERERERDGINEPKRPMIARIT